MKKILLLSSIFFVFSGVASAQDDVEGLSDHLTLAVGQFEVFNDDYNSGQFAAECRFKPVAWGVLRPVMGASITTDSGLHAYAGAQADFEVTDNVYLIPSIVAGGYRDGDGKNLGSGIEFRSGLELAYEFECKHRVGLQFSHISNASIGNDNPGAESLMVTYSIPTGKDLLGF